MPVALLLALEGLARDESEDAWGNLSELLQYTPQTVARYGLEELGVPTGTPEPFIEGLAASSEGSRLAALIGRCDNVECVTSTHELWIWDTTTWRRTHGPIPAGLHTSAWSDIRPEQRLAFSQDGEAVVFPSPDGLAVFRLADASVRPMPAKADELGGIAWAPDGGVVRWLEPQPPEAEPHLRSWDPRSDAMTDVQLRPSQDLPDVFSGRSAYLSPGGRWAVTVDEWSTPDGTPVHRTDLFDASTGARLGSIPSDVFGFGSTDDILIARDNGVVRLHALPGLDPVGVATRVVAAWADVSVDGTQLIVREGGSTVSAFDVATGERTIPARPSTQGLSPVAASSGAVRYAGDGSHIAVLDLDRDSGLSSVRAQPAEGVALAGTVALSGTEPGSRPGATTHSNPRER